MTSIAINLSELYNSYRAWVIKNPQTASDVESSFKWISYFIAGRINSSVVLTELVYTVSNLLVLFNDQIIHSSRQKLGGAADKIKVWLTVLEYSEVFIEITAKNFWGKRGKWMIIICVQLLKLAARITLLLKYKEKMMSCPPIYPLKRNLMKVEAAKNPDGSARINNIAFSLKRSGRVIRKVDTAPPMHSRMWKPPSIGTPNNSNLSEENEEPDKTQLQQHLTGEILYIVKPVVHLGALLRYGRSRWKPWLISLAMDLTSLYLLHSNPGKLNQSRTVFSNKNRLELSRRHLALLLYLMRSPFYDRYSKVRVEALLDSLARNIPLARLICKPLKDYIPYWQDTYFYLWSS